MNLDALKAAGAFVAPDPVKESVTWNGHTFDVWIKPVSFADSEKMREALSTGDASVCALVVSKSVLLGDEQEPLSYDDAVNLDPSLGVVLVSAIQRVKEKQSPKA